MPKKYKYTGPIVGERGDWAFFVKGIGRGYLVRKRTKSMARKTRKMIERLYRSGKY